MNLLVSEEETPLNFKIDNPHFLRIKDLSELGVRIEARKLIPFHNGTKLNLKGVLLMSDITFDVEILKLLDITVYNAPIEMFQPFSRELWLQDLCDYVGVKKVKRNIARLSKGEKTFLREQIFSVPESCQMKIKGSDPLCRLFEDKVRYVEDTPQGNLLIVRCIGDLCSEDLRPLGSAADFITEIRDSGFNIFEASFINDFEGVSVIDIKPYIPFSKLTLLEMDCLKEVIR